MRNFFHATTRIGQVPASVVTSLSSIDFGRGSEALYAHQQPALLIDLASHARVASITASSAIEGVIVPDVHRAETIIAGRTQHLRNRDEQELAGYRDALDHLFQRDWQPLNVGLLLHLHRLLFGHTVIDGGRFKSSDNLVVDRAADGSSVRFRPVAAAQTPSYVEDLVDGYGSATTEASHHPVLLAGLFVLDLTVIHPFEDGNGRVARAITNALLSAAGYGAVRFISMEQLIAESADDYYAALLASTHGWHTDESDPWPWLDYFVHVLAKVYVQFGSRAANPAAATKQDRVRQFIRDEAPSIFRFAELRAAFPSISEPTIRAALNSMRDSDEIRANGLGRNAAWIRIRKDP
jgi:Fic family protein